MTDQNSDAAPGAGQPPVDFIAILSAMQDQLDDLAAVVEAQQRQITELRHAARAETKRSE